MTSGIPCTLMRGGTSKGAFFLARDLPTDLDERDDLLLRIMGSPDPRQIDGVGGAHPLTTKVAIVGPAAAAPPGGEPADVDYLFLQLGVDEPVVTDQQNCGNMLAGVAPFAIEAGVVDPGRGPSAEVRIRMVNTGGLATATLSVEDGQPIYDGDTTIAGVPFGASPVRLDFAGTAGGSCGALLPTGNQCDTVAGVEVTLIDNGMPVVCLRADAVGVTGTESCADLEANDALRATLEEVRLAAGPLMNLGDVTAATVPKLTMVAPAAEGGAFATRTFIPHRCHDAIGVLGAVSVATAALLPDAPIADLAVIDPPNVLIEHPTGTFEAVVDLHLSPDGLPVVERSGIIRTARKLMEGVVFPRA